MMVTGILSQMYFNKRCGCKIGVDRGPFWKLGDERMKATLMNSVLKGRKEKVCLLDGERGS